MVFMPLGGLGVIPRLWGFRCAENAVEAPGFTSTGAASSTVPMSIATARRPCPGIRWMVLLTTLAGWTIAALGNAGSLEDDARQAFVRGDFPRAAHDWQQAATEYLAAGNPDAATLASLSLAGAWQALGQQLKAVQLLEKTLDAAEATRNPARLRQVKSRLGGALVLTLDLDRAETLLEEALSDARQAGDNPLAAAILNDRGNLLRLQGNLAGALAAFHESAELALRDPATQAAAQPLANAAATALRTGDTAKADQLNARALAESRRLPASHSKAFLLLSTGTTDLELATSGSATNPAQAPLLRAHQTFTEALALARTLAHPPLEAQALTRLGLLYETDRQPEAALDLARRAAFAAQQATSPDALFRAEWLVGRLLRNRGEPEPAIAAYRRAVLSLQPIRHDLALGYGNATSHAPFRESVGPMFFELADLLLRQARTAATPAATQTLLREARDTVEQLKAVELEDYFQDECVNILRSKSRSIDTVDAQTAVVYLVPLPDRTEVLVGVGSELHQFIAPVGAQALTTSIRDLRRNLETRTSHAYLIQARQLHDWLIAPVQPLLAERGISTLVFVPDGALRTIPLASLHDGNQFLVEQYAVAIAPGLSLIEARPLGRERPRLLMGGLTQPVQGFPPLYFVADELDSVGRLVRGRTLSDDGFTSDALRSRMESEQFSIVHLASHGQFNRDVRQTFLLTYDDKLTLNDLESLIRPGQYRGRPVELLVLSACQTAAGDDRAALGLAGVAVKAGARSALASLWFVNDQSTSTLVSELYAQLRETPNLTKAGALQAAQKSLLADRRFRHPCYWSPYLIVGNWL
jgi:CHAT domain-containing protein/Tfp pilus assembly protein PilF